jgi:hypothetical protein
LEPSKTAAWRELYSTFIRTHLDPGWWPDDIWTEVQRIEARSPRRARGPYSSPSPESRDEFTLGGQPTPRAELEHRLGESVDSFCRTFEQLRSENSYFHGQNLVNAALRAHTGRAAATNEVRRLWEVARAARDVVTPESLHVIACRLFDFGDQEVGFECLLLAYERSSEYYSGSQSAEPFLVELCERDRDRVLNFLVERSGTAFGSESGGFDLPQMIARFFSACGDVGSLRQVFEDYLQHCEELFMHLPKEDCYKWLRDYNEDGRDESEQIVEFLVDLIDEPDVAIPTADDAVIVIESNPFSTVSGILF